MPKNMLTKREEKFVKRVLDEKRWALQNRLVLVMILVVCGLGIFFQTQKTDAIMRDLTQYFQKIQASAERIETETLKERELKSGLVMVQTTAHVVSAASLLGMSLLINFFFFFAMLFMVGLSLVVRFHARIIRKLVQEKERPS